MDFHLKTTSHQPPAHSQHKPHTIREITLLSQPLYTIKTSPYCMANCLKIQFKLQPPASHNHHLHKQLPHDKKPHANHKQALGTVLTASCSCQPKASCIQPSSNPAKVSKHPTNSSSKVCTRVVISMPMEHFRQLKNCVPHVCLPLALPMPH